VSEVSISFASSMTIAKSVLTTAFFGVLLIGVILNLKKKEKLQTSDKAGKMVV
jgi:hypothetical protein